MDVSHALSVRNLRRSFTNGNRHVVAVDDVSFEISAGETLALAGPSGSGKSTIARLVTRIIEPQSGSVDLRGESFLDLSGSALRERRRLLQMVFQDTTAAFSPHDTVQDALNDPLHIHNLRLPAERAARIAELLTQVGLDPGLVSRRVHDLSGGQRQRIAIARALACEPAVLVLDEALSAVDASRRLELVEMLVQLQGETGMAYLFIAHDLGMIRAIAHRVAIMDHGRIVETGRSESVIGNPQSEICRAMVAAAPRLETQ